LLSSKRRSEEKASHRHNLLPEMKMMKAQTMMEKILAIKVATTVAVAAVTLMKVQNTRRLPRRLTSLAEIAEKLALLRRFV
jgi:hypothetical protein